MRRLVWLLLVTLFFVTMNVLLWRSEFGGRATLGSAVRPQVVLERMLHSSDYSDLEIRHRQQKIGRCRWTPSLLEEPDAAYRRSPTPEGMVRGVTGYTVDLDGDVGLRDLPRLRFNLQLKLATNHVWSDLHAELSVHPRGQPRPIKLTLRASAARRVLRLSPPLFSEGDGQTEEVISFDDLQNPDKLLRQFAGPGLMTTLSALGLPLSSLSSTNGAMELEWQATKGHRIQVGRWPVPVYGLRTRLFGRHPLVLYVTESGELFRVELPGEITLVNEKLLSL
jgi:hypothetical protein